MVKVPDERPDWNVRWAYRLMVIAILGAMVSLFSLAVWGTSNGLELEKCKQALEAK